MKQTEEYRVRAEDLRLRLDRDPEGLSDAELLELLITEQLCGDKTQAIRNLVMAFGGINGVLSAEPDALTLADGINGNAAATLRAYGIFRRRVELDSAGQRIDSLEQAAVYVRGYFCGRNKEEFLTIGLDETGRVVLCERVGGDETSVAANYERLLPRITKSHTKVVLLCHNHPSGSCTPSAGDLHVTDFFNAYLCDLGIKLWDHLVVGKGGTVYSLRREREFGGEKKYTKNEKGASVD